MPDFADGLELKVHEALLVIDAPVIGGLLGGGFQRPYDLVCLFQALPELLPIVGRFSVVGPFIELGHDHGPARRG
jgi:hypothetical protein